MFLEKSRKIPLLLYGPVAFEEPFMMSLCCQEIVGAHGRFCFSSFDVLFTSGCFILLIALFMYDFAIYQQDPFCVCISVDCVHLSYHWYNKVLYKWFLTPFRDSVLNRCQVSVCDRRVLPT